MRALQIIRNHPPKQRSARPRFPGNLLFWLAFWLCPRPGAPCPRKQPFLPNKAISGGLLGQSIGRQVDRDRRWNRLALTLGLQPLQLVQRPEQAALEGQLVARQQLQLLAVPFVGESAAKAGAV